LEQSRRCGEDQSLHYLIRLGSSGNACYPVKRINDPNSFPAMPQIIIIEKKVMNKVKSGETEKA
jgi:hypothetical protein